jgi:plastocyanin
MLSRNTLAGAMAVLALSPATLQATQQTGVTVSGRLTVLDQGDRQARDVGTAVVWLESPTRHAVTPDTIRVIMNDKAFGPNVVTIPTGSVIEYLNTDPFNHNVFSLSPEGPFDLGLYGRGESHSTTLNRAGILRVYCNVHARMNAFVVVRDNPFYTQPAGGGSFAIGDVPPGQYEIVAWHERASAMHRQPVTVRAGGATDVNIQLDARGYQFVQHSDKHGKPYRQTGRRY